MKMSGQGISFLKKQETLRLKAYFDGGKVPTDGWGHTKNVKISDVITEEQAEQFLISDIHEAELAVQREIHYGLAQHQFDMLVSLVFNIGIKAFKNSTLLKRMNKGDILGAADQFLVWHFDNGKEVSGLLARRNRERKIFLEGY